MNQYINQSELIEQAHPQGVNKWKLSRTVRGKVTLPGLVIVAHKKTPLDLENLLIPWDQTFIYAKYKLVILHQSDGMPMQYEGRYLQLNLVDEREARLAVRAKKRFLMQAWRNGELVIKHIFDISNKSRKLVFIKMFLWLIPWVIIQILFFWPKLQSTFLWTGHIRILMLLVLSSMLFCSSAFVGVLIYFVMLKNKANVKSINLNTEGIEVFFLDGRTFSKSWHEISSIKRCHFSFEVKCNCGEKFAIPASGSIRPIIKMIQRELYKECEIDDKLALKRSMNRSYVWCVLGGIISAGLTFYLQSLGLTATSGPFPAIGTFLAIGILLPAFMMFSNWYETNRSQRTIKRGHRKKSI